MAPKGWTLFQMLIDYMRKRHGQRRLLRGKRTPEVMDRSLWEASGHWQTFGEHMFTTQTEDERVFAIKPMNCPGHVQVFKNHLRSYRALPLRIAEFGSFLGASLRTFGRVAWAHACSCVHAAMLTSSARRITA